MKINVVKFGGTSILRDFEIFNKLKDQRQNLDDDVEIIKKFDIFSMMELNWDTEINCLFTNILRQANVALRTVKGPPDIGMDQLNCCLTF